VGRRFEHDEIARDRIGLGRASGTPRRLTTRGRVTLILAAGLLAALVLLAVPVGDYVVAWSEPSLSPPR